MCDSFLRLVFLLCFSLRLVLFSLSMRFLLFLLLFLLPSLSCSFDFCSFDAFPPFPLCLRSLRSSSSRSLFSPPPCPSFLSESCSACPPLVFGVLSLSPSPQLSDSSLPPPHFFAADRSFFFFVSGDGSPFSSPPLFRPHPLFPPLAC